MIIIVEGPDRAGKSGIVNELYSCIDTVRVKAVKRQAKATLLATKMHLDLFELNKDRDFLCDRLNITSERVYAPLIDQKPIIYTDEQIKRVERRLNKLNAFIIMVKARKEVIMRRYRTMGEDDYVPKDKIRGALRAYESLAEKTSLPVRWVDTSKGTAKHNVPQALEHVKEMRRKFKEG